MWTFIGHTVSRCLTLPAVPEVAQFAHSNKLTHVASLQFLPSGQYGLCFGYCFSSPPPLRFHNGEVTFHRACFWESLVIRLHSEIGQIHLSIEAQCLPMGDHHKGGPRMRTGMVRDAYGLNPLFMVSQLTKFLTLPRILVIH